MPPPSAVPTSPRGQAGFSYVMCKAGEENSAFCGLSQRLPTQASVLMLRRGTKCSLVVQSLFAAHGHGVGSAGAEETVPFPKVSPPSRGGLQGWHREAGADAFGFCPCPKSSLLQSCSVAQHRKPKWFANIKILMVCKQEVLTSAFVRWLPICVSAG